MLKNINNKICYSASDLADFTECQHKITLKRANLDKTDSIPLAEDAQLKLLQKKGAIHEQEYLNDLEKKYIVEKISNSGSYEDRHQETLCRMRDLLQPYAIYQGVLMDDTFVGITDFLVAEGPYWDEYSAIKSHYEYQVVDTKLARHTKTRHLIQICLYSDLLSAINNHGEPEYAHIILGNGIKESYYLPEYTYYYASLRKRFEAFIKNPTKTSPEKCSHCGTCDFQIHCAAEWEKQDHLNRVANIRAKDIKTLKAAGTTTLAELAKQGDPSKNSILGLNNQESLWRQATLQLKKQNENIDTVELKPLKHSEQLGFCRLPLPNPGDIYFDMEGDPLEEGGLEYLFGAGYLDDEGQFQFKAFWGCDRSAHEQKIHQIEERQAFEAFIDWVMQRIKDYPNLHIYHYADYERRALRKLMSTHGTRENEVDTLLREQRLVDLYAIVRHAIYTSEPKYSIKNLETFYMKGQRQADVKNAGASIIYFEQWKETGDQDLLKEIEKYNKDDCESTWRLQQWLLDLKPIEIPPYQAAIAPVVQDETEPQQEKTEAQYFKEHVEKTLISTLPTDPFAWKAIDHKKQLLYHLLDFYWREKKPYFWKRYDRQSKTEQDWLDDLECIAGLEFVRQEKDSKPKSKSHFIFYRFPNQEYRLQIGDDCEDTETLKAIGKVVSIHQDSTGNEICLRVGPKAMSDWQNQPPSRLSINACGNVNTAILQDALLRYIQQEVATPPNNPYQAISDYLCRLPPRLKGGQSLKNYTTSLEISSLETAIKATCSLDNSYLFIQGPPGTGKTYTGSHIILELLKQNKRVGVCANSHKAVINLLKAVERVAAEQGFEFKGAKKTTGKETEHHGKLIVNINNDDIYHADYRLVGGTAWVFANPKADQLFDYLFVDEAGQVCLANLIAMATSAKNLVLFGDQMQLGQPIQGTHPGESGLSALDFLLQGKATVPNDKGFFLATSWRMHPDICSFISDIAYENRLQAHPDNAKQRLFLSTPIPVGLKESGICFLPVEHEGCSQSSEIEASKIADIVAYLLQQSFQDRHGENRLLTTENILIVAPYNAQVQTLHNRLPKQFQERIGTVDKFQGWEAEVVIISMATSSQDYLPRNMEFLFNKQRLNVAISRARTLAILVANPKLTEIKCSTPQQMALVNTLCRLAYFCDGY